MTDRDSGTLGRAPPGSAGAGLLHFRDPAGMDDKMQNLADHHNASIFRIPNCLNDIIPDASTPLGKKTHPHPHRPRPLRELQVSNLPVPQDPERGRCGRSGRCHAPQPPAKTRGGQDSPRRAPSRCTVTDTAPSHRFVHLLHHPSRSPTPSQRPRPFPAEPLVRGWEREGCAPAPNCLST